MTLHVHRRALRFFCCDGDHAHDGRFFHLVRFTGTNRKSFVSLGISCHPADSFRLNLFKNMAVELFTF